MQERKWGLALRLRSGLFVCALLWTATVFAQAAPTGASMLSGKVLDPESKVVVNAAVIVRNEATNEIRTTSTDTVGHFSITGLASGMYTIEVAVPGFEIVRRTGVRASEGIAEGRSLDHRQHLRIHPDLP